ncbi:MAG: hypothetical protein IKG47_11580 [Oscillospiraceae bacterium]|nr:hypothetical protein [Oscillospiraceae bacterium]
MMKKTTKELEGILLNAHSANVEQIFTENNYSFVNKTFSDYFKDLLSQNKISQQKVFIDADISEKYGYKLISGEKHTNQRDTLLRLCYAGKLNVEETNRSLILYGMSPLYARNKRDALLIIAFNDRVGDILDLNEYLIKNGEKPLKNSGNTE